LAADPTHAEAYRGLVLMYRWLDGREEDALAEANQAVESAPESAAAYVALAWAEMASLSPDPARAVAAAEQAAELDQQYAWAHAALAHAYLMDRRHDQAVEAAEKAVALEPELAESHNALAWCRSVTADFGRAAAALDKALELEPDYAPWHENRGDLWFDRESYDMAALEYEQALEHLPDYVAAMLNLARVAIQDWQYDEAQEHIGRALKLAPDHPSPHRALGFLHEAKHEPDEAMAAYRQALVCQEGHWSTGLDIGFWYVRQGEQEGALRQFQELAASRPRFPAATVGIGIAKLLGGDTSKALEYFRKALKVDPCYVGAHIGMGDAYREQQRWDEAVGAYSRALECSATQAPIHARLASAFLAQEDTSRAAAEAEISLRLRFSSVEGHNLMASVRLANGEFDRAREEAALALVLDPDDCRARELLGMALANMGESEEAIEVLEEVVEEEPEHTMAHLLLGLAYRDLGQYSRAAKEIRTHVALLPEDSDQLDSLTVLLEHLEQGYVMTESKAMSDMREVLDYFWGESVETSIEQVEGQGRTLVFTIEAEAGSEEAEMTSFMSVGYALAALYLPRVEPVIENGAIIRVVQDGRAALTLRVSLEVSKKLIDGTFTDDDLIRGIEFSRSVPKGAASVEEIRSKLAETRELGFTAQVHYHALPEEGFEKRLNSSVDAESREALRSDQAILQMLGLIEPDEDLEEMLEDLYADQVAAFYAPKEKAIYVRETGEQTAFDQTVIAHEYTHALQDQHYGLEQIGDESLNSDRRLAFDAVVEGDAVLAMLMYSDEHVTVLDYLGSMSYLGDVESEQLEASPLFVQGLTAFPYLDGLVFVRALYDTGGWESVNHALEEPPRSTEQILHPSRYREGDEPEEVTLPDLAEVLGDEWTYLDTDVMGELALRLALAQHAGPAVAEAAAEGWGGDRYALLQQGSDGPHLLVIHTRWDDLDEAEEFWDLYRVCMAHRRDFKEHVKTVTGEVDSRWWMSGSHCAYAHIEDRCVTLIVGPRVDVVPAVVPVFEGLCQGAEADE